MLLFAIRFLHSYHGNYFMRHLTLRIQFIFCGVSVKMFYELHNSGFLGWYMDHHLTFTPATTNCIQEVSLVGLAEYNLAETNDKVIVKIAEPTQERGFYVMFNRAIGINEGTDEGGDQVLITRQDDHSKSADDQEFSYLLGRLDQGNSYTITNFDGTGLDL